MAGDSSKRVSHRILQYSQTLKYWVSQWWTRGTVYSRPVVQNGSVRSICPVYLTQATWRCAHMVPHHHYSYTWMALNCHSISSVVYLDKDWPSVDYRHTPSNLTVSELEPLHAFFWQGNHPPLYRPGTGGSLQFIGVIFALISRSISYGCIYIG